MISRHNGFRQYILLLIPGWFLSCAATSNPHKAGNVLSAWQHGRVSRPDHPPTSVSDTESTDLRDSPHVDIVATIDGRVLHRDRFVAELIAAHGAATLDEWIEAELACAAAADRGLSVTQADVRRERDLTFARLADFTFADFAPADSEATDPPSKPHGRTRTDDPSDLLDQVLASRNLSRRTFDRLVRRNACLRRIVHSQQAFTEAQLRDEFDRLYGKRVEVRHIQLPTLADVERIRQQLALGESFAELSRRYSAHTVSAQEGGRLEPFSSGDERIPALFRQVAFSLQPGEVSNPLRIGEWYHLIKVERILPARNVAYPSVRDEVAEALRNRETEPAKFALLEKLRSQANIVIHDPELAKAYEHARSRGKRP